MNKKIDKNYKNKRVLVVLPSFGYAGTNKSV